MSGNTITGEIQNYIFEILYNNLISGVQILDARIPLPPGVPFRKKFFLCMFKKKCRIV